MSNSSDDYDMQINGQVDGMVGPNDLPQPDIDDLLMGVANYYRDDRVQPKISVENAKQAIFSLLASEAVEVTEFADSLRIFEAVPLSVIKELLGVAE